MDTETESTLGIQPLEEATSAEEVEAPVGAVEGAAPVATAPTAPAPAATEAIVEPQLGAPKPPAAPEPPQVLQPSLTEIHRLQQLAYQQQVYIDQQRAAIAQQQAAEEDRQIRGALEGQGYTEDQVAAALQRHGQLRQREQALAQREQEIQRQGQLHMANTEAKFLVIQHLSEQYGIPAAQLRGLEDPYVMEERAKNYQLQQENTRLKQEKVKPQVFAATAPGGAGPMSKDRLTDRYLETMGEGMTREELKVVFPDRY